MSGSDVSPPQQTGLADGVDTSEWDCPSQIFLQKYYFSKQIEKVGACEIDELDECLKDEDWQQPSSCKIPRKERDFGLYKNSWFRRAGWECDVCNKEYSAGTTFYHVSYFAKMCNNYYVGYS